MKDKQWLKDEINALYRKVELGELVFDEQWILNHMFDLAQQLGEPEMTEEQAWEILSRKYGDSGLLQENIAYVESQGYSVAEKVVIPDFVAEFLERYREQGKDLADIYAYYWNAPGALDDVTEWIQDNFEETARAWLDSYEIEKEKRYRVAVPDAESNRKTTLLALARIESGSVTINKVKHKTFYEGERCKLTEEEIKRNHEYLWPFAEEVTQ